MKYNWEVSFVLGGIIEKLVRGLVSWGEKGCVIKESGVWIGDKDFLWLR